ncbi:hypothetical protein EDB87DRAFT_12953 [Lactarius vividus]|nr:hypothetical protein EDB87DRAFT_12953 [Lactarius vividus]
MFVSTALAHGYAPLITTFHLVHLTVSAADNPSSALSSRPSMVHFLPRSSFNEYCIRQPTASCLGRALRDLRSSSNQRPAAGLAGASCYIPPLSSALLYMLQMRSGSSGPHEPRA